MKGKKEGRGNECSDEKIVGSIMMLIDVGLLDPVFLNFVQEALDHD